MTTDGPNEAMTPEARERWKKLPLEVRHYIVNAFLAGPLNFIDAWGRVDMWPNLRAHLPPDIYALMEAKALSEMSEAGHRIKGLVKDVGALFGVTGKNVRQLADETYEEWNGTTE